MLRDLIGDAFGVAVGEHDDITDQPHHVEPMLFHFLRQQIARDWRQVLRHVEPLPLRAADADGDDDGNDSNEH